MDMDAWLILASIATLGIFAVIVYSIRKRERMEVLQGLKTDLEALAMHTKMKF